jgi:eukaryotic-like serine/threonine-protein kinase
LMLEADLLETQGELPVALARVERVLLRQFEYPGARERHASLRDRLGLSAQNGPRVNAETTTLGNQNTGPFQIVSELGRGGSATIYKAFQADLQRHVALKVYHDQKRSQEALLSEARVAVALADPGVLPVIDVSLGAGYAAYALAARGSLRDIVNKKEPVPRAQGWLLRLVQTLGRIHAKGYVHNDIKPGNLLFGEGDRPLLGDFGIARRAGERAPQGSLGYVSPERIAGRPSDARDDIFGVGRILQDLQHDEAWLVELGNRCAGPDAGRPADGLALTALVLELGR